MPTLPPRRKRDSPRRRRGRSSISSPFADTRAKPGEGTARRFRVVAIGAPGEGGDRTIDGLGHRGKTATICTSLVRRRPEKWKRSVALAKVLLWCATPAGQL